MITVYSRKNRLNGIKASKEDYTHRAAKEGKNGATANDGDIIFASGHMTPYQLEAMFKYHSSRVNICRSRGYEQILQ